MNKKIKENDNKKVCSKCRKLKDTTNDYYLSSSSLINADGRLPICKSCLWGLVKDYNNTDSVINVLRMIDRPFIKLDYEGSKESNKDNPFKEYMRRLAMKQNRELTYADSDFPDNKQVGLEDQSNYSENELNKDELHSSQRFWGKGFLVEDYVFLNDEYQDYLNRYEVDTKAMEDLVIEICLTKLDIRKRRMNGEKVDQQLKTLQDLLGSSNLKPVQETGANAVDQESFGTLIKKFEREKPIPEPDPKWKDVDGIGKYIRTFFLGHMSRAIGVENKFIDEYEEELEKYTVKEEDLLDGED